jgi:4-hydroxybenzoate polyprenyltransferase
MYNYLGQLRAYSFADLILLLVALEAGPRIVFGVSLLWAGFLIHLEWRHRDRGRFRWHWSMWVVPWLAAPLIVPSVWLIPFYASAVAYAYKKRFPPAAAVSPLVNGGLKTFLVLLTPAVTATAAALVLLLMSIRNLLGDVRDAEKDYAEGVRTLPVVAGYRRATPFVYPIGLMTTSAAWTVLGGLPWWALAVALAIQAGTYHLTPR